MKYKIEDGTLYSIDEVSILQEAKKQKEYLITLHSVSDDIISTILNKAEDDRTIEELQKIVLRKQINDTYEAEVAKLDGYLPIKEIPYEGEAIGEYETLIPSYEKDKDYIYKSFTPKRDRMKVRQKIDSLKSQLSESDYKVIKMYEAKILMEEMPYSEDIIHERQALRDKINELEELIKTF